MRFHLLAALLLAGTAMPAAAQDKKIDRRVEKLEQELRAVQRKVFPGGNVEPEIRSEVAVESPGGVPASSAVADLTARLDALEAQLARLTGANEEAANRVRVLEEALNKFRGDAEYRLTAIEGTRGAAPAEGGSAEAAPAPAPAPARDRTKLASAATPAATPASLSTAGAADEAEAAYLNGFRMWEGGRYADAAPVLEEMAKKFPKHRRASYAQNLAGRAYLDDGKPATAAKILLANYQANPKGDRAADSLYFLGQALAKLEKNAEACKVYDELQEVYPGMRDWLKARLPEARAAAKCDG
ncbi:MAG TPA: tetratricopeptide repeat protein [Allosphingosinicella sp.]|jgi:TolA-binding protein